MAERRERLRTNDPEGMRTRILDAAADLFQARGYHGTSVQDVIREASITGGALHHHFASKKQLGLAVIRHRVAPAVQDAWIAPVERASDVRAGVREAFDAIARDLEAQGFVRGCPLNNLAIELAFADSDFQRELASVFDAWRGAIASALRAAAPQRTRAEAEDFATLVVAAYSGAMALAKATQDPRPLRAALRSLEPRLADWARNAPGQAC